MAHRHNKTNPNDLSKVDIHELPKGEDSMEKKDEEQEEKKENE